MPGASVKVGPVRVGSGCCVALVIPAIVVVAGALVLSGIAFGKQYVLKNPKQHCRAHYVKRTKTIKKHEHGRTVKVHETLCVYVAPKTTPNITPTPAAPAPTPMPTPEPFTTTTTLSATLNATSSCKDNGDSEGEFCEYIITYSTINGRGEIPSGASPTLESRIPPAAISEPIAVPSGSSLRVFWLITIHNECAIYVTINHTNTEVAHGTCERLNPRIVLTATYAHPASGWLASQSEPVTIR